MHLIQNGLSRYAGEVTGLKVKAIQQSKWVFIYESSINRNDD
jgi:hypothetical protein